MNYLCKDALIQRMQDAYELFVQGRTYFALAGAKEHEKYLRRPESAVVKPLAINNQY